MPIRNGFPGCCAAPGNAATAKPSAITRTHAAERLIRITSSAKTDHSTRPLPRGARFSSAAPPNRIAREARFPNRRSSEDAGWTAERRAVEFKVEIGEYQGI